MRLSDARIRALKPTSSLHKHADGGGLSLWVFPSGTKGWRFRYRRAGRETMVSFGNYPEVSLAEARERRDEARAQMRAGVDPSSSRKAQKQARAQAASNLFQNVAQEYVQKRQSEGANPRTLKKYQTQLGPLLSDLGTTPISEIEPPMLLQSLRKIEARGARYTATEARSLASRIFRYAIATGRSARDPAADLKGALLAPVEGGYNGITDPQRLAALLLAIDGYPSPHVRLLLLILAHTFVRPGSLRSAEWNEIDLSSGVWRIPASKGKNRRELLVPLSPKVVQLFAELHAIRLSNRFVAASSTRPDHPVSEMTLNKALKSLGFSSAEHVPHGFRITASTLLNEQGWNSDWIERQLDHVHHNKVRRAYNVAQYLDRRTEMMRAWSAYLEKLMAKHVK